MLRNRAQADHHTHAERRERHASRLSKNTELPAIIYRRHKVNASTRIGVALGIGTIPASKGFGELLMFPPHTTSCACHYLADGFQCHSNRRDSTSPFLLIAYDIRRINSNCETCSTQPVLYLIVQVTTNQLISSHRFCFATARSELRLARESAKEHH